MELFVFMFDKSHPFWYHSYSRFDVKKWLKVQ